MVYEIGENESVSNAVIVAVSSAKGCDPATLRPLYEVIDPDALERLFDSQPDVPMGKPIEVTFDFSGYRVTVTDGEEITLRPMPSARQ